MNRRLFSGQCTRSSFFYVQMAVGHASIGVLFYDYDFTFSKKKISQFYVLRNIFLKKKKYKQFSLLKKEKT